MHHVCRGAGLFEESLGKLPPLLTPRQSGNPSFEAAVTGVLEAGEATEWVPTEGVGATTSGSGATTEEGLACLSSTHAVGPEHGAWLTRITLRKKFHESISGVRAEQERSLSPLFPPPQGKTNATKFCAHLLPKSSFRSL